MSHTKAGGSSKNGRDSQSKRLGVKLFGGQSVKTGDVIIRQRGTKFIAGNNVLTSKDYTLHAKKDGKIAFSQVRATKFTGSNHRKTRVNVV